MSTRRYTHPTGPGYCGVYAADNYTVEISVAAMDHIEWTTDTSVVAVDDPSEHGIQLVAPPVERHTLGECSVENRGHGTLVHVHPPVLRALEGFERDGDIRVYEFAAGLTVVPRDGDPYVGGDSP